MALTREQITGMLALTFFILVPTLSCNREPAGIHQHDHSSLTSEESEAWDATAVFITGVFTLANADSLDSTIFLENFRANYDWINNVFLPHLKGTPEHPWWKCDEYCVKMAKKLAKGDKEKEKELMETLSRYKLHERDRDKIPEGGQSPDDTN
jgi:hypothetical protein